MVSTPAAMSPIGAQDLGEQSALWQSGQQQHYEVPKGRQCHQCRAVFSRVLQ